ncbi:MAG: Fungal specific transcription factor [Chaenotheca gracillima]|nr:MAG: Fungal specific transcription factor [Chaenotheca gracillima]
MSPDSGQQGAGGHGCISFLREKYISAGPPNGGDGGSGGNVYIQAVQGETSLHKLGRRRIMKAGRGKNGRGKGRGGERGEDVLLQVPIGTVVKEISRLDPVAEEDEYKKLEEGQLEPIPNDQRGAWRRDKWILYPASLPSDYATADFPALPRPRRSNLTAMQPEAPVSLDLSKPMEKPILLAAGAMGGLGNPHFCTKSIPRPKFATKGEVGMQLSLSLELKMLADVGLVGLPNAGKSTLLRALSRSRARIGDWPFTTLAPNIGTVVLDDHRGRPTMVSSQPGQRRVRERFSVADIPGLIEGAHLDRGLGLGFLRHIERAGILAFVVDLSGGDRESGKPDPVATLKGLWRELREYANRIEGEEEITPAKGIDEDVEEDVLVQWTPGLPPTTPTSAREDLSKLAASSLTESQKSARSTITAKPWFVIATKADLASTQEAFQSLQVYLQQVERREKKHPCLDVGGAPNRKVSPAEKMEDVWGGPLRVLPVSAINHSPGGDKTGNGGVDGVVRWALSLLDGPHRGAKKI